jgi:hypothetical protein
MRGSSTGIALALGGLAFAILFLLLEVREHARVLGDARRDATPAAARHTGPTLAIPALESTRAATRAQPRPSTPPSEPAAAVSIGPSRAAILEALHDAVEEAPASEISRRLRELAGIDEEELRTRGMDPRRFASRLVDAAVRGTLLDEARDGTDVPGAEILFSSSADEFDGPLLPTRRFHRSDLRIIAWIPSSAVEAEGSRMLVKWLDVSTGRLEMLRAVYVSPDRGSGHRSVSLRRMEGWTPGRYRVEVLRFDETLATLASGDFVVGHTASLPGEATSSLELFATDPALGASPPIDAVLAGTERLYVAARVTGKLPFAVLVRPADGIPAAEAASCTMLPPVDGSPWRVFELRAEGGLAPGVRVAELRSGIEILERRAFPVLESDPRR